MPLILNKDLVTGVLFTEIVRQHPTIQLIDSLIQKVFKLSEALCSAFPSDSEIFDFSARESQKTKR
jgi:hypothetical protein